MDKALLYASGLIFAAYGVLCLIDPSVPAGAAGLAMQNGDGAAEIGAMYGGFQTGFGLYLLLCARRPALAAGALWALLLGIGLLAVGRSYHALTTDGALSAYTYGAIAFESLVTLIAAAALARRRGS